MGVQNFSLNRQNLSTVPVLRIPISGTHSVLKNVFKHLHFRRIGCRIAPTITTGASPMWRHETAEPVSLNWIAILSYTGSAAVSLAIWVGLFRVVEHFVK